MDGKPRVKVQQEEVPDAGPASTERPHRPGEGAHGSSTSKGRRYGNSPYGKYQYTRRTPRPGGQEIDRQQDELTKELQQIHLGARPLRGEVHLHGYPAPGGNLLLLCVVEEIPRHRLQIHERATERGIQADNKGVKRHRPSISRNNVLPRTARDPHGKEGQGDGTIDSNQAALPIPRTLGQDTLVQKIQVRQPATVPC